MKKACVLAAILLGTAAYADGLSLLGSYKSECTHAKHALLDDGATLLAACGSKGLRVLDISQLNSVQTLATLQLEGQARNLALSSDRTTVYVAGDAAGLQVVDVSDPDAPVKIGEYATSGQVRDLHLSADGETLYLADDINGLLVLDVSNPAAPSLLSSTATGGQAVTLDVADNIALAAVGNYGDGVVLFDLASPAAPLELGSYTATGHPVDVEVIRGGTAMIVADGSDGLFTVDLTDPTDPRTLTSLAVEGAGGLEIFDDGNKLLASDGYNGIELFDITGLDAPAYLGGYTDGTRFAGALVAGNRAYTSNWDQGLRVLTVDIRESETCSEGIFYAQNPQSSRWAKFFNSCDVPYGWNTSETMPRTLAQTDGPPVTAEYVEALSPGWHMVGSSMDIVDLAVFDSARAIWRSESGVWQVHANDEAILEKVVASGYNLLYDIPANGGFWVQK